jgi:hypothetical protein
LEQEVKQLTSEINRLETENAQLREWLIELRKHATPVQQVWIDKALGL